MSEPIYKIVPEALWRPAEATGHFDGAPVDLADGFIHFSTAGQVRETAARHFSRQAGLLLVAVDADALGAALRYEVSRGGALFPHLYAQLPVSAVLWARPLPLDADGNHLFPDLRTGLMLFEGLGRRLLFCVGPETAHGMSIAALRSRLPIGRPPATDRRLATHVAGLDFPNPLGMAAGYDKNAEVPDALLGLGFGFAEVGTVTPLPQAGNPRPRIFRLAEDHAVINRLGFNNEGHDAALRRLETRSARRGIVGVNIGANKDSADRVGDYVLGVRRFAAVASYLTVNISSPNTPGLRDMQARGALAALLSQVAAARRETRPEVPIFLKIAPDLAEADLEDIAAEVEANAIDGVIVSNTTLAREGLRVTGQAAQSGGLSGRPLFSRATAVLARMRRLVGPDRVLIGVGGVDSDETAIEKIRAGADLVQLYTGLIYGGPALPARILTGMAGYLQREGLSHLSEIRDSRMDYWAGKPL